MAPKSTAQKSDAEVKKQVKRLLKEIEVRKEQARKRGRGFASPSEEQLIRKIRGETSNSPFFIIQEWDSFTTAGSRSYYIANYVHFDPRDWFVFATMFFGLTDFDPDISSAIRTRDTRWPCVSTELVALGEGETGVAYFEFTVPYAPKGTYHINAVLWTPSIFEGNDAGVGKVFDRGGPWWITLK